MSERPEIPQEAIIRVNNSKRINFTKGYKLIYNQWWFYLLTFPFYFLCYLLVLLCAPFLGLRVIDRKKVRQVMRQQGCITVSNHCHYFDTVFANLIFFPTPLHVSVVQRNFEVPGVRWVLRFLRAFPIPASPSGLKMITAPIGETLKKGYHVHFLPEGELVHLSQTIYRFKPGAFCQSYLHQAPLIPMVYVLKRRRFFGKKMGPNWVKMHCVFGDPIFPPPLEKGEDIPKEKLKALSDSVATWMEKTIAEH